jgi:S-DNA-T family DNA segregation ATPase FtsK/SpoIIIE
LSQLRIGYTIRSIRLAPQHCGRYRAGTALPFEDAEPCRVLILRRHVIVGGATGSGKSGGLNELLASLAACRDVVIWAIDLKRGMEFQPWAPCIDRLATTPEQAAALLADAVTILYARAQYLADHGRRAWEPSERMPALVIIIDEYAELAEQAPAALKHTDTIARLGRAPAVTLVAATQRPTQKVMGQGAVRSQMNIRIAFRVQEQRDVDLILGQGMHKAGWHAHKLDAPGKFLIWSPEHGTPRRARGYLLTDNDVQEAVARHASTRPHLDAISRHALTAAPPAPAVIPEPGEPGDSNHADPPGGERQAADNALWLALGRAPQDGYEIAELIRLTGMTRATLYRRLREHARHGHAIQVSRGRWRGLTTGEPSP